MEIETTLVNPENSKINKKDLPKLLVIFDRITDPGKIVKLQEINCKPNELRSNDLVENVITITCDDN